MRREEVENLPSSLITCFICDTDKKEEVKINKVSPESITFRSYRKIDNPLKIDVYIYCFKKDEYEFIEIKEFELCLITEDEFSYEYDINIKDKGFADSVKRITRDYTRYITLKNFGDESEFSKEMVNYPNEKDYDFYECYEEQKHDLLNDIDCSNFNDSTALGVEFAVSLDNNILYEKFLKNNFQIFIKDYLKSNYINNHEISRRKISRIYIGNEFCHNLFPSREALIKMMDKAYKENIKITICFTYLRDLLIDETIEIVDEIYNWCNLKKENVEIVINDFGMIDILKNKNDRITTSLGVLLNKRRKDPRLKYKNGIDKNQELLCENGLNSKIFQRLLCSNNISRYEYDSCGDSMFIAEGKHSLHLPFYVTNVSQYCPLHAMCTTGNRGQQKLVFNCPQYCSDYVFNYPKHLKMVGRYNSIFAFDDILLTDGDKINNLVSQGIDRIVLNFI